MAVKLILSFVVTAALALGWLRLNDFLAHKGLVSGRISRKIIHMGTGPIFVLCWLFFPDSELSRYVAALIPLGITIQFALIGLGILSDPASVKAMSRSGDRREILRGPLFYGIVFVILTIWFWKENVIGIVALMILCGGDGLADIIGKRFGKMKLPWSVEKSLAGSLAVFVGGLLFSVIIIAIYLNAGALPGKFMDYLLPVTVIAAACTLVESLPFRDIDNITVPIVAVMLGFFILPK